MKFMSVSLVAIAAIVGVFGVPIYFTKRWYDYREKKLHAKNNEHELRLMRKNTKQLMGRVADLENIVLDTEYELNTKLSKLELQADNTSSQKLLKDRKTTSCK